jgi:hypothetical protein
MVAFAAADNGLNNSLPEILTGTVRLFSLVLIEKFPLYSLMTVSLGIVHFFDNST